MTNKKRFQVSFTDEQYKKLTLEAIDMGFSKSTVLALIFEDWLKNKENKNEK